MKPNLKSPQIFPIFLYLGIPVNLSSLNVKHVGPLDGNNKLYLPCLWRDIDMILPCTIKCQTIYILCVILLWTNNKSFQSFPQSFHRIKPWMQLNVMVKAKFTLRTNTSTVFLHNRITFMKVGLKSRVWTIYKNEKYKELPIWKKYWHKSKHLNKSVFYMQKHGLRYPHTLRSFTDCLGEN